MFGARTPLAAYRQVGHDMAIETADPHRLIVMLFEGAMTAMTRAQGHMEKNQIPEKGSAISKAIDIITNGLQSSLNLKEGGELAERLSALYEYICHRLLWANLKNDLVALKESMSLLGEIQSAWVQIGSAEEAGKSAA